MNPFPPGERAPNGANRQPVKRATFLYEVKPQLIHLPSGPSGPLAHPPKPQLNSRTGPSGRPRSSAVGNGQARLSGGCSVSSRQQQRKPSLPDQHIPVCLLFGSSARDMPGVRPPRCARLLMGLALKDCGKQSALNKVKTKGMAVSRHVGAEFRNVPENTCRPEPREPFHRTVPARLDALSGRRLFTSRFFRKGRQMA